MSKSLGAGILLAASFAASLQAWSLEELIVQPTVTVLSFAPDAKTLAAGSDDGVVNIWDPAKGESLRSITAHPDGVKALGYSHDGKLLATGCWGKTISIWQPSSGKLLQKIQQEESATAVAFAPTEPILATSIWGTSARLWDVSAANKGIEDKQAADALWSLSRHQGQIEALAFAPDGKLLATAGWDKAVMLWETRNFKFVAALRGHASAVTAVTFSPDGKLLATGSADDEASVKLWERVAGAATFREIREWKAEGERVWSLDFSPDGKSLAAGTRGRVGVFVWDVKTGNSQKNLPARSPVDFSPDGSFLATGSVSGVALWQTGTWNLLRHLSPISEPPLPGRGFR